MFTFGFFTTNIPYVLLLLGYFFYFITAIVDKDLADKWFSTESAIALSSDGGLVELEDYVDFYDVVYVEPTDNSCIFSFPSILPVILEQPHAAVMGKVSYPPTFTRPPTV